MPGALTGAASCARCGRAFDADERFCIRCGVLLVPASTGGVLGTYSGMLSGVAPATAGRRNAALAIDLAPGILIVLAPVVLSAVSGLALGVSTAVAAVALGAYLVLEFAALTTRGTSVGRAALRLRTVDDLTGDPVGVSRFLRQLFARRWRKRIVTSDLQRGRDPLALAQVPLAASVLAVDESAVPRGASSIPAVAYDQDAVAESVTLVLDNGERQPLSGSMLIGRVPEAKEEYGAGDDAVLLGLPDLSRALSKTHALLEWSGSVLWVTDLNSTNGTALVNPAGERQLLVAGLRGAAGIGWTIEFGGRPIQVRPSGSGDAE